MLEELLPVSLHISLSSNNRAIEVSGTYIDYHNQLVKKQNLCINEIRQAYSSVLPKKFTAKVQFIMYASVTN